MSDAPVAGPPRLQVNSLLAGAFFGVLQWSTFFLLQSYLSSAAIVYLLATSLWLLGSLVGLAVPGGAGERWWLAAATASYYALLILARANPYDLRFLPLLLFFVAGMGAYAGRFFRYRARAFGNCKWLFFLENSGFVAGMLFTVIALFWSGETLLLIAPAAGAVLCAMTLPREVTAPAG